MVRGGCAAFFVGVILGVDYCSSFGDSAGVGGDEDTGEKSEKGEGLHDCRDCWIRGSFVN